MRILQISPNDHAPFETLTARYAQALEQIGHEVSTLFLRPPVRQQHAHADYLAGSLKPWLKSNGRFDAVIAHRYRALRSALGAGFDGPILTVAHEFGLARRGWRRLRLKLGAKNVRFAGVSNAVVEDLADTLDRPALHLPNAIDVAAFQADLLSREEARRRLYLDADAFVVAVVGRLHWWKQPEVALAAFASVAQPHWRLAVLGEGERLEALGRVAVTDSRVKLFGFRDDARQLYRAFDRVLIASTTREAFNMVALEAGLAGVPVVTTPCPGPLEVMDGSAAFATGFDAHALATALAADPVQPDARELEERYGVAALAARLDEILRGQVRP